jgi:hypothetical protein
VKKWHEWLEKISGLCRQKMIMPVVYENFSGILPNGILLAYLCRPKAKSLSTFLKSQKSIQLWLRS